MGINHISFENGKANVIWENIPINIDPNSIKCITEHNPDQYIPLIIN